MGSDRRQDDHFCGSTTLSPDIAGCASFDWLRFHVEGHCLSLTINGDTDEIVLDIEAVTQQPSPDPQLVTVLRTLVGKQFFWLWRAENSQGYEDAVMMSFASSDSGDNGLGCVAPQIAFVGAASSIQIFRLLEADD